MSEQSRTVKIYNLLAELMSLLVKVTHIFHLIQGCQLILQISPHRKFLLALWQFLTVKMNRGILLKTIVVKRSMTWPRGRVVYF